MATTAQARRLGRYAARRRLPVTTCPYPPDSDDPAVRAAAGAWMSGYLHAAPPTTVDYSDTEALPADQ